MRRLVSLALLLAALLCVAGTASAARDEAGGIGFTSVSPMRVR